MSSAADNLERDITRINKLAWRILELKFGYYYPNEVDISFKEHLTKADAYYDNLEEQYKQLCSKYNISPTAVDMVSFDLERPSCRLVRVIYSYPKTADWKPIEL